MSPGATTAVLAVVVASLSGGWQTRLWYEALTGVGQTAPLCRCQCSVEPCLQEVSTTTATTAPAEPLESSSGWAYSLAGVISALLEILGCAAGLAFAAFAGACWGRRAPPGPRALTDSVPAAVADGSGRRERPLSHLAVDASAL